MTIGKILLLLLILLVVQVCEVTALQGYSTATAEDLAFLRYNVRFERVLEEGDLVYQTDTFNEVVHEFSIVNEDDFNSKPINGLSIHASFSKPVIGTYHPQGTISGNEVSWDFPNYTINDGDRLNVYAILEPEGGVTGIYAERELNRTTFDSPGVQEVLVKFRFYNRTGDDCAARIAVSENGVVMPEVLDTFETNFPYEWVRYEFVRSNDRLIEIGAHCSDISDDEYYLKGYVRVTPKVSGTLTFKPRIWISKVLHVERDLPLGFNSNFTISKPEYDLEEFTVTTQSLFNWSMKLNFWTSLVEIRQVSELSESSHPVANFTYYPPTPVVSEMIFFNASSSYDPDGSIVSYSWNFGDGSTASGQTVQHTYSQPGNYTVTLTVTDNDGLTASITKTITVDVQAEKIEIYDNFESYQVNTYPSQLWENLFSGKTAYVSDYWSWNSQKESKSFRLEGYPNWARIDYIPIPQMPDKISYEVVVYPTSSDGGRRADVGFVEGFGNYGPMFNYISLAGDGNIYWVGSESVKIGTWEPGKSYRVRAEIDFISQTADIYLEDGVFKLVAKDVPALPKEFDHERWGHVKLSKFGLGTGNFQDGGTNVVYFDSVKLETFKRIWPVDAPTTTCYTSKGVAFPSTGENSADWFNYGNCGSWKVFEVVPGKELKFALRGDECPGTGNVLGDIDFDIYEYVNGQWILKESVDGPNGYCGFYDYFYYYTPQSDRIKVVTNGGFYLELYQEFSSENNQKSPVASFTFSLSSPTVGQTITFDASSSYDPDGQIISYSWNFGDGSTASGVTVSHTYSSAGTYTVTLTITDNDSLTASTSRQITVQSSTPPSTEVTRSLPSWTEPGSVIQVTLTSTSPTIGMQITETIPSTFTLINYTYSGADNVQFSQSGNTLTFTVTDMAANGFTITYTLQAPSTAGSYTFSGTYQAMGGSTYAVGGDTTITVSAGESNPDNVDDTLEQLVTKYCPSFDWTTDTPTQQDVVQAVTNAVSQYFSTTDPAVRQEIVSDVIQLVALYFQL